MLNSSDKKTQVDISFPEIEKFDQLPLPKAESSQAFVTVMEGCSKYCSFCVVPYTRGEEVSRDFDDILTEASHLANQGVREINLLGQNVNAYRGSTFDNKDVDLALLINYVASIEGIDRIRFTTSHPIEFNDNLINIYKEVPELVSHLHLPVQSGSDRILAAMKRGHTALEYKSIIRKIVSSRPNISLSSDFIVGFPGETNSDFEDTMNLIIEIGFDTSFSFIYSPRPGTPAQNKDNISLSDKKARLSALQSLLTQQQINFNKSFVNKGMEVLFEKIGRHKDQFIGRTIYNQSTFVNSKKDLLNQIMNVKIINSTNFALECQI